MAKRDDTFRHANGLPSRSSGERPEHDARLAGGDSEGVHDRTETLDRLNADLQRAKAAAEAANEAKSRYLVAVSHEIRSPLNAIYGYAQLLERGDAISTTEAGTVIRRSAEHLTNLVESLLEISRIESSVLKIQSDVVDIRSLLTQVAEMFRAQASVKGLYLELDISNRLPEYVKTDEKRLRQILINLISNAVKYTNDGGLTVSVAYRSQVADLEVRDTGIGIVPGDLERVFEPFERGSSPEAQFQPGIGLGLAITRALARVMGGDISATSMIGSGSTFRLKLMLPSAPAPIDSAPPANRIEGYRGDRRTILVVDDDPAQIAVIQSLLRPLDFVVYAAPNGPEGIALAEHCSADLVLLDIQMPGMSGWQVAEHLRAARGNTLKIVMVSANADELRGSDPQRSHHDAFITKPFEFDGLLNIIGAQLHLHWERARSFLDINDRGTCPLPAEAGVHLEQLSYFASIGHVRGIEEELDLLEENVPASTPLVAELRRHLDNFDLRALSRKLEDAELR